MKYEKVYSEEFDYYYPSELGSGVAIPLTPCIELLNANSNRIAELEAKLANAEHKNCEIERTCSECNKAFILKAVHHNPNLQETISIFDNCPHCHARNDIWVKISWLSK
jgi:hypothetical protein